MTRAGSPQMWVRPQLVFGGSPSHPHCNWRTLPSSQTPSLPALSFPLPPTPLCSFSRPPQGRGPVFGGGGLGALGRKGVGGAGLQSSLGARPTFGGTRKGNLWTVTILLPVVCACSFPWKRRVNSRPRCPGLTCK